MCFALMFQVFFPAITWTFFLLLYLELLILLAWNGCTISIDSKPITCWISHQWYFHQGCRWPGQISTATLQGRSWINWKPLQLRIMQSWQKQWMEFWYIAPGGYDNGYYGGYNGYYTEQTEPVFWAWIPRRRRGYRAGVGFSGLKTKSPKVAVAHKPRKNQKK